MLQNAEVTEGALESNCEEAKLSIKRLVNLCSLYTVSIVLISISFDCLTL